MDFNALLVALDEHIRSIPGDPAPAELFAVRVIAGEVSACYLWSGVARELPGSVVPPAGCVGIALSTSGWSAPMNEGRASLHPQRRRVRSLTLITGAGQDYTRLESEGEEPQFLSGAVGPVPDLLVGCWSRRLDAA